VATLRLQTRRSNYPDGHREYLTFSSDSRRIAVAARETVRIWDIGQFIEDL
jgi:hypothetical protein